MEARSLNSLCGFVEIYRNCTMIYQLAMLRLIQAQGMLMRQLDTFYFFFWIETLKHFLGCFDGAESSGCWKIKNTLEHWEMKNFLFNSPKRNKFPNCQTRSALTA